MTDDVIKNPARNINTKIYKAQQEPYQPEHVKLGLDLNNPIKMKENKEAELNRRLEFQIASSERLKKEKKMSKLEIPKQIKVASGASQEHVWLPQTSKLEMDWFDESQSDEGLVQEEIEASSGVILDEEIIIPSESGPAEFEDTKIEDIDLEITDTPIANYCIMIDGGVVAIVDSLEEAERVADFALFSGKPPFESVTLENIAVFKRLNIKAGISLQ